jgi:AraC-like DNA-binding protein
MDTLSRVLESVRCDGARFVDAALSAPWSLRSDFGRRGLLPSAPAAAHLVSLCFVVAGSCRVRQEGGPSTIEAVAGDLLLFLGKDRYRIASDLHVAPIEVMADMVASRVTGAATPPLVHGGGGEPTRLVLGSIACGPSMVRALLESLPASVHLRGEGENGVSVLRELLRIGVVESGAVRAGVDSLLARLSEMVLVEALRRYAAEATDEGSEWLAASRDPRIGRALALMHADPSRAWTLDELARTVALSRSALADRFARLVGQPPMRYLTRWRLALAAQALRSGAEAMVRVAERAGYDSDAAFSRAFQREFGMPPSRWRRRAHA